jgi:hypothetical protein
VRELETQLVLSKTETTELGESYKELV